MVSGKYKSRSLRRISRRTPGSKVKMAYVNKKPGKPKCGDCGAALSGIKAMSATKAKKATKTKKRPQRKFGGVLCSKCSRKIIKLALRTNN